MKLLFDNIFFNNPHTCNFYLCLELSKLKLNQKYFSLNLDVTGLQVTLTVLFLHFKKDLST